MLRAWLAAAALSAVLASGAGAQTAGCDLCKPAFDGDLARVEQLLEQKADVAAQDQGFTPLGWALANNHDDIALLLLAHHADPNVAIANLATATPLEQAVRDQNLDLVRALLAAGAKTDPDSLRGALGWTGNLTQINGPQNIAIIQTLIAAGADPNYPDDQGQAFMSRMGELVGALPSDDPRPANLLPTFKVLLTAGASPNQPGAIAEALRLAGKGDPSLITLLLAYGGRIDGLNDPLPLDSVKGEPGLSAALVDAGAAVDQPDASGDTALSRAAARGDIAEVRTLIDLGADLDHRDHEGLTPIDRAVKRGDTDLFALLIKGGANLRADRDPGPSSLNVDALTEADILSRAGLTAFPADGALQTAVRQAIAARAAYITDLNSLTGRPVGDGTPLVVTALSVTLLAADTAPLAAPQFRIPLLLMAKLSSEAPEVPAAALYDESQGLQFYRAAQRPSEFLRAAILIEDAANAAPWVARFQGELCVLYHTGRAYHRAAFACALAAAASSDAQLGALLSDSQVKDKALRGPT